MQWTAQKKKRKKATPAPPAQPVWKEGIRLTFGPSSRPSPLVAAVGWKVCSMMGEGGRGRREKMLLHKFRILPPPLNRCGGWGAAGNLMRFSMRQEGALAH